jgi:beta-galactosidase
MAGHQIVTSVKKFSGITIAALMLFALSGQADADAKVTTLKDANGWKLQVDGKDFYVKGVVWDYKPVGTNYSYNLYGQSDEFIKNLIDHEFGLMAEAGITATRSFVRVPPKWVSYIFETYGIMTVVNPLMGRYGITIDGKAIQFTDYSDPRTREVLKAQVVEFVEMYRDVPGVLMFALGNESNYGLSWSSFEIENLPVGEQNQEKAKYLYSLFNEVIEAGRRADPERLFTIVNGDIQYLDLIAEYGKGWDLLGINAYRGISFDNIEAGNFMWREVKEKLDLPVVLMEFGSDAFNARDFAEDQAAQASYLRGQWQEIYSKSYGSGAEGNALGGFVFEWRDEWWKHKQTENLEIQDRTASWANGGYKFDFVEGQNNMNEEWFGITRIGELNEQGVYQAETRMAYDVLKEIWRVDPYAASKPVIDAAINDVDMEFYSLKSDIQLLKKAKKQDDRFRLVGGSFKGEYFVKGSDSNIDESGENGLIFTDGQMLDLDFAFQPTNRIKGDFTLNVLANVADSDFEFRYGDRGKPLRAAIIDENDNGVLILVDEDLNANERVEIYDFQASYEDQNYDLLAFYHTPRYHWGYEGDFFGLMRETTDMEGQDIWNSKAPYGVEFAGKGDLGGLKVVAGPEIYWGANPKAMVKYEFGEDDQFAFIFSEDLAERDDSSSATEATERQSRQLSLYAKHDFSGGSSLELGGIISGNEKVGDLYDRLEGDDVVIDEIVIEDTLGFKAKYGFDIGSSRAYVAMNYAGLVADGGDPLREFNTELPYSALGNKQEVEAGIRFYANPYMIYPRLLYRENLVDANPTVAPTTSGSILSPGIDPRNRDDDPFAVLDNREASAAEIYFTYDPTPGTWFYDWDIDMIEDAPFAYNIGLTATSYESATDANLFFFEDAGANASFGQGIAKDDLWLLKSKMIFNSRSGLKSVFNWYAGTKQSSGKPGEETLEFFSVDGKLIVDKKDIYSAYIKVDDFGPYDFYQQFNLVYPLQLKIEYARLLDLLGDELRSSKIGVKALYRTLDERSPADEYDDGKNDYMMEIQTYFQLKF